MNGLNIKSIAIIVITLFLAFYLGSGLVNDTKNTIGEVLIIAGIFGILALGRNIWMLMFAMLILGTIKVGPGIPPWLLLIPLAFIVQVGRAFFEAPKYIWNFCFLDIIIVLFFLSVFQTFVRTPTGIFFFESENIGGKPYFMILGATICYIICSLQQITLPQLMKVLWYAFIINGTIIILQLLANLGFTPLAFFNNFYTLGGGADIERTIDTINTYNNIFNDSGKFICLFLISYFIPYTVLLPWNYIRFSLFVTSSFAVLLPGRRSNFIDSIIAPFLVASLIKKNFLALGSIIFLGTIPLSLLIISEISLEFLPIGIQRTLTPFPVNISPSIRAEAEGSTTWRFYMWEEALFTNKLIKNKIWGDGFALKKSVINQISKYELKYEDSRAGFMYTGSYHNGPITAIKYIGYTGLFILILLFISMISWSWKISRWSLSQRQGWLLLIYTIPIIFTPFSWILYLGDLRHIHTIIIMASFLKLVINTLKNHYLNKENSTMPILPSN